MPRPNGAPARIARLRDWYERQTEPQPLVACRRETGLLAEHVASAMAQLERDGVLERRGQGCVSRVATPAVWRAWDARPAQPDPAAVQRAARMQAWFDGQGEPVSLEVCLRRLDLSRHHAYRAAATLVQAGALVWRGEKRVRLYATPATWARVDARTPTNGHGPVPRLALTQAGRHGAGSTAGDASQAARQAVNGCVAGLKPRPPQANRAAPKPKALRPARSAARRGPQSCQELVIKVVNRTLATGASYAPSELARAVGKAVDEADVANPPGSDARLEAVKLYLGDLREARRVEVIPVGSTLRYRRRRGSGDR